jgi:S-adenosylmethionine synthetase
MRKEYLFTSESVTEGHPDKLCDQISDAIVDQLLVKDPCARVRAECAVSNAIVFIMARFFTSAKVDLPHIARKVIKRIGYEEQDFNSKTCSILTVPQGYPPDKTYLFDEHELTEKTIEKIKVKNQVTVFGFACDQTSCYMPLPIYLANKLTSKLSAVRHDGTLPYLMPDGKVQVGIQYKDRKPFRIYSVNVTASQKKAGRPSMKRLCDDIIETVIKPSFKGEPIRLEKKTKIHVNPDGPIVLGGPSYHSGLTGRKSAVDTYGEYSRHSGDALSGKDPVRIDRVGAYAARYAAKNVVAAGLAEACEVMLSYSIGISRPVSLQVNTSATSKIPLHQLQNIIEAHFDFRLGGILRAFNLRHLPSENPKGYYQKLATYGHMGRTDMDVPWEQIDKAEILRKAAGI